MNQLRSVLDKKTRLPLSSVRALRKRSLPARAVNCRSIFALRPFLYAPRPLRIRKIEEVVRSGLHSESNASNFRQRVQPRSAAFEYPKEDVFGSKELTPTL